MTEPTKQELNNSQEFKRRLGEAFASMPEVFPGAALIGKYFTLSGSHTATKETSKELAASMVKDMQGHSENEIIDAMYFITTTVGALRLLYTALSLDLAERRNPKRN